MLYDTESKKKKRTLPDMIEHSKQYHSNEFHRAAFNPRDENILVTITGQPDWKILLWNWERSKLLAITEIGLSGAIPRSPDCPYNF